MQFKELLMDKVIQLNDFFEYSLVIHHIRLINWTVLACFIFFLTNDLPKVLTEYIEKWHHIMPYEHWYQVFSLLDGAMIFTLLVIILYTFYMMYRLVANEYDPTIQELNKKIEQQVLEDILKRLRLFR